MHAGMAGILDERNLERLGFDDLDARESSRQLLLEAVGSPDQLVLVLCGQQLSDQLAAAGARELLRGRPYREICLDELAGARGQVALLLSSGFSRAERDFMPRALAIAEMRFERVVVLPTSFDPSDDVIHAALSRARAVVFARDPESYQRIAGLCDARLAHDCSFFFDFAAYAGTGSGVLHALSANGFGPSLPRENGDNSATVSGLDAWLRHIAAHETIRTDRAHLMIAAALMGKRVEYATDSDLGADALAQHAFVSRAVVPIEPSIKADAPAPAAIDPEVEARLACVRTAALATRPPSTKSTTTRVTAVVLTRDRPGLLVRALESIERSRVRTRTVVLDNNSGRANARAVATACDVRTDTVLRRLDRNLGGGAGRNLGVELADTEFVLFLDDDAELMPGALEFLVAELDRHPRAGAVTATVVQPDGTLLHSGGSMSVNDDMVMFELLGFGVPFDSRDLPSTGPSGWAPTGAMLARRDLLVQLPLDETLGAYYEDNEWCYRVSRARPGTFRRSREALMFHHGTRPPKAAPDFVSRSRVVELLASIARFYELHGLLLAPWLFDHVAELRADDGTFDVPSARLLMELVIAKGAEWVLMEWMNRNLDALLTSNRRLIRLREVEAEAARHASRLRRIEESVTWQLLERTRERAFATLGGERSPTVRLLQSALRRLGRNVGGAHDRPSS